MPAGSPYDPQTRIAMFAVALCCMRLGKHLPETRAELTEEWNDTCNAILREDLCINPEPARWP